MNTPSGNDHARPVLRLSRDGIKPMALLFHTDEILTSFEGKVRRLVNFDFDTFEFGG